VQLPSKDAETALSSRACERHQAGHWFSRLGDDDFLASCGSLD
jgi:hypothetical protein